MDIQLQEHEALLADLKHHLMRAQHRLKTQADKHHSERVFHIGDRSFSNYISTSNTLFLIALLINWLCSTMALFKSLTKLVQWLTNWLSLPQPRSILSFTFCCLNVLCILLTSPLSSLSIAMLTFLQFLSSINIWFIGVMSQPPKY